jgi:type I restriction enzyme S subunit
MKANWPAKKLGDLCKTGSGGTPLKARKEYYESGTVPWLLSGEVSQGEVRSAANFITKKGLENSSAKIFPRDTVLVAMYGATAGQVGILRFEAATNQAVCGILPNKHFVPEFLFYLLLSKKDDLVAQATGNAQPNISQIKIRNIGVPLAPLPEQQRIVGILDKAFDGIATAKTNAEKNLQNARALFESQLQAVFTQRDTSHVVRRLEEVCKEITVGHVGAMAKRYKNEGIPFLRSQNIRPFHISLDSVVFIDEVFHRSLAKSQLRPGDVAVVRTGYPGTAAVIPESLPVCNCSDLVIVRPGPTADPHYLAMFFNSNLGKKLVAGRLVGAAQKHFNVTAAKQVAISFPPMPEQRQLVKKLQVFRVETQRLGSIYQQKSDALDALKKSLLHQAFSGQL